MEKYPHDGSVYRVAIIAQQQQQQQQQRQQRGQLRRRQMIGVVSCRPVGSAPAIDGQPQPQPRDKRASHLQQGAMGASRAG